MGEHVLNHKIKLSDGSFAKILSKGSIKNTTTYNCHLCRVSNISDMNIRIHMQGKKHTKNMNTIPDAEKFRVALEPKDKGK